MCRLRRLTCRWCWPGVLAVIGACESSTPSDDPLRIASVSAGAGSTCTLTDQGEAYCWGILFDGGPLIDSSCQGSGLNCRTRPDTMAANLRFRELKLASNIFGNAICGVTTDALGYCWGTLLIGNDGGMEIGPAPVPVGQNLTLESIAVGSRHYCGLGSGGTAYCAGDYRTGVRGTGMAVAEFAEPDLVPNQVSGGLAFSQLTVGLGNSCGLSGGQAYCWGWEIALGTTSAVLYPEEECGYTVLSFEARCSHLPVPVEGGHSFISLAAGTNHVCGLTADGALYCWGSNGVGQLGRGDTAYSATPVQVALDGPTASISAGEGFSCALGMGGQAFCWGSNDVGQTGTGSVGATVLLPMAVAGGAAYRAISAGRDHVCAIRTSGPVECWGSNYTGQLGNGTLANSAIPVPAEF